MILKHPLYKAVTVYVIGRDAVFTRMLELELTESGLSAVRCESFPAETKNGEIRVFTVSSEVLEESRSRFAQIEYGFSETGTGRSGYYFKRPFAVEDYVNAVIEIASEMLNNGEPSHVAEEEKSENTVGLYLDGESNTFFYNGEALQLTSLEHSLLKFLYENRGSAVTREEILAAVWNRDEAPKTNLTDVYIRYLRKKLDDRFDVRMIISVRGQGYMLK